MDKVRCVLKRSRNKIRSQIIIIKFNLFRKFVKILFAFPNILDILCMHASQ